MSTHRFILILVVRATKVGTHDPQFIIGSVPAEYKYVSRSRLRKWGCSIYVICTCSAINKVSCVWRDRGAELASKLLAFPSHAHGRLGNTPSPPPPQEVFVGSSIKKQTNKQRSNIISQSECTAEWKPRVKKEKSSDSDLINSTVITSPKSL